MPARLSRSGSVGDFAPCLQPLPDPRFTADPGPLISASLRGPRQATVPALGRHGERSRPPDPSLCSHPVSLLTRVPNKQATRQVSSICLFRSLSQKKKINKLQKAAAFPVFPWLPTPNPGPPPTFPLPRPIPPLSPPEKKKIPGKKKKATVRPSTHANRQRKKGGGHVEGRGPTGEPPTNPPQKTTFEKKKKWEKLNAKPRDMGSHDGDRGDPRPGLRGERRPVALRPCSGALLEGPSLLECVWEERGEGRRPPVGLCVRRGRAGARVLRSTARARTGSLAPPQTPGSWGAGVHAGECPPSRAGSG